jgi:hypothetical protein
MSDAPHDRTPGFDYLDAPRQVAAPIGTGAPRPGHGTVYLMQTWSADDPRTLLWEATWVDPWDDEPGPNGENAGVASIQGSRDDVLAWVRAQPAASFVMAAEGTKDFVPIPERDDDVKLREPRRPRERWCA